MTNAAIQNRLAKLEVEVKTLKSVLREAARSHLRAEIIKGMHSGSAASFNSHYWRDLRTLAKKAHAAYVKKPKKLPRWMLASLKDIEEGRTFGPFDTVEELRASLESKDA